MKNSFVFKSNQLGSKVPPLGNFSPFAFYLGREAMCPPPKKKKQTRNFLYLESLNQIEDIKYISFFLHDLQVT